MAFNEFLADKLRQSLKERKVVFEEKKMMGGLCIMVDDKMCIGVIKDDLMARVGPHEYQRFLDKPCARVMDFTKRPMKGYLYVNPAGWDNDDELSEWVDQCLEFNKEAKSSKKK
ncbi:MULTISPECIES: TfoX/Sxy family protein [unclassified Ekhidna]|jgi:TfoX/Sxy family transcriptional regulator of competence genes|uniref:TfoX/Sxy family protein n=1 Tax=unclassified Ekhidna TaxID=2632188 RepID=UPI0032DEAC1B